MSVRISEWQSLESYNTFGIKARAAYFAACTSVTQLGETIDLMDPELILGGGSNILLTKDIEGLVLHVAIKGRDLLDQDSKSATIRFGAGENWHEAVLYSLDQGYGGLENLSLIPGTVGAAPIQNIGAYGVELRDVFMELEALELSTGKVRTFDAADCQFGYRDSFFKGAGKGKWCITSVVLKLTKEPVFHLDYGAIRDTLKEMQIEYPTHKAISEAVIKVRRSKLPDPSELGNSGSFFKNPEIPVEHFQTLRKSFPDIVHYPMPNDQIKIPAGWLIEQCGWKGKRVGKVGAFAKQALVLVNYGGATGKDVWELAMEIRQSVKTKFGIILQPEVNVI